MSGRPTLPGVSYTEHLRSAHRATALRPVRADEPTGCPRSRRSSCCRVAAPGSVGGRPRCWLPPSSPGRCRRAGRLRPSTAVELADTGGLVEVGPQALGSGLLRPAVPADRWRPSGPNSSKAKTRSGKRSSTASMRSSFSSLWGVVRLLPRLGPLEGDVVLRQHDSQPLSADAHRPGLVVGQVVRQLGDAPTGEGQPDRLRPGLGRLDDEGLVVSRDAAGTATRPLGVRGGHPHLVEPVDHLAHPVG